MFIVYYTGEQTALDDLLIWSTREYFSSAGKALVISYIRIAVLKAL